MIRNILIALSTILLFAAMAWTTIAASPSEEDQAIILAAPVEYTLPYPGLLPDSPLYPLKTFRDKVISFFITDAKKQAAFDLLQADKRLSAAQILVQEKSSQQLISQTASKGENYFGDAVVNVTTAKKQGMFVNDFLGTLQTAGLKHEQVLLQMAQTTKGQLRQNLLDDVVRVQKFEKQVASMKTP